MKSLLFIFVLIITSINLYSKKYNVFEAGEVLEYEVSYLGITLGTITVESLGEEIFKGKKIYRANSYMKTSSGIPFVELNDKFSSWMDTSLAYSYKFTANSKMEKDVWGFQQIDFNYDQNQVYVQLWENKDKTIDTVISTNKKFNDGTSLFFIARAFVNIGKDIKVPTMINVDDATTILNFRNEIKNVKIDAIDYEIETVYFNGKAVWEGIYGLSGKFEGWFTNDEASIPVLAKMNVYIGNVVIELKSWKRKNWKAPMAKSKKS